MVGGPAKEIAIHSVNMARMTMPKKALAEDAGRAALRAVGGSASKAMPMAIAVQEHKNSTWGHYTGGYEPWLNACPLGPAGGNAGGVGWLVNQDMEGGTPLLRTPALQADGEGAHMCWVRMKLSSGESVDMASI